MSSVFSSHTWATSTVDIFGTEQDHSHFVATVRYRIARKNHLRQKLRFETLKHMTRQRTSETEVIRRTTCIRDGKTGNGTNRPPVRAVSKGRPTFRNPGFVHHKTGRSCYKRAKCVAFRNSNQNIATKLETSTVARCLIDMGHSWPSRA